MKIDMTNPLGGLMSTAEAATLIGVKSDALTRAIALFPQYAPGKIGGAYIWTEEQAVKVKIVAERITAKLCPHCGEDPRGVRKPKPAPDVTPPLSSTKDKGGNGTGK